MNYKEEIVKLINSISQEHVLQFFYSLLRVATSDIERYEKMISSLFTE